METDFLAPSDKSRRRAFWQRYFSDDVKIADGQHLAVSVDDLNEPRLIIGKITGEVDFERDCLLLCRDDRPERPVPILFASLSWLQLLDEITMEEARVLWGSMIILRARIASPCVSRFDFDWVELGSTSAGRWVLGQGLPVQAACGSVCGGLDFSLEAL